jgi:hypothetical protein
MLPHMKGKGRTTRAEHTLNTLQLLPEHFGNEESVARE